MIYHPIKNINMNFRLNSLILLLVVLLFNTKLSAQYLKEKKLITGTWISEKAKQKFVFRPNGTCTLYFSEGGLIEWKYTFTNQLKDCDSSRSGIAEDSSYYLHLKEIKIGYTDCYIVNSLDSKELSLSPFGRGGAILFLKQRQKRMNKL